jgi:hypothetical protein
MAFAKTMELCKLACVVRRFPTIHEEDSYEETRSYLDGRYACIGNDGIDGERPNAVAGRGRPARAGKQLHANRKADGL